MLSPILTQISLKGLRFYKITVIPLFICTTHIYHGKHILYTLTSIFLITWLSQSAMATVWLHFIFVYLDYISNCFNLNSCYYDLIFDCTTILSTSTTLRLYQIYLLLLWLRLWLLQLHLCLVRLQLRLHRICDCFDYIFDCLNYTSDYYNYLLDCLYCISN
jgi:hypothetical protein